jgi:thymidine phosphorylase
VNAIDLITAKRDGARLSDEQIAWFIDGVTHGAVPEHQASALLMAILFRGMAPDELAVWTRAMIDSGSRLDLSPVSRPTVDKHSTGGVGDKISLPLVPLVAACGAAVPQLAGRGLGHTGGTLDKMAAVTGFRSALAADEFVSQLGSVGGVIAAQTADIAPADRVLYALRDVTGTVPSIPLIASSIMSKKIAEGTSALVLDVKVGSGAFMRSVDDARRLAETMVAIGNANGVKTVALLTDMDTPLGRTAGNAVEVAESIDVLRGNGPLDVVELTLALAHEMLSLAGLEPSEADRALADGRALATWERLVAAQGGDLSVPLPEAPVRFDVVANDGGFVHQLDALAVGVAAWRLGAGRAVQSDPVDPAAGVVIHARRGEAVVKGEPVLTLHTSDPSKLAGAMEVLLADGAVVIGADEPEPRPLVIERIA